MDDTGTRRSGAVGSRSTKSQTPCPAGLQPVRNDDHAAQECEGIVGRQRPPAAVRKHAVEVGQDPTGQEIIDDLPIPRRPNPRPGPVAALVLPAVYLRGLPREPCAHTDGGLAGCTSAGRMSSRLKNVPSSTPATDPSHAPIEIQPVLTVRESGRCDVRLDQPRASIRNDRDRHVLVGEIKVGGSNHIHAVRGDEQPERAADAGVHVRGPCTGDPSHRSGHRRPQARHSPRHGAARAPSAPPHRCAEPRPRSPFPNTRGT